MPSVTFIDRCGRAWRTEVPDGWSLLEASRGLDIDIEGACDGNMACATCHVVVEDVWYDRLAVPSVEEEEMLDLASGLAETSRLGCQVRLSPELDGLTVRLPDTWENR